VTSLGTIIHIPFLGTKNLQLPPGAPQIHDMMNRAYTLTPVICHFLGVGGGKYERQEEPNQIYERQDFCLVASKNNSSPCMSSLFGANWPLHALLALLQKKVTSLRLIRATIATSCELRVRAFTFTKLRIIKVDFASLSLLPVLVSLRISYDSRAQEKRKPLGLL
jgi:hypothetical protein